MIAYLRELYRRRDLIVYLTLSKLKGQHKNSFLGYFWWLLDPLLNVAIYYFVVVGIFRSGGPDYGIFLVIGMIVWRWVSATVGTATISIVSESAVITQVPLPKAAFPVGAVLAQLINFVFGMAVVAIFLVFFHIAPGVKLVWLPLIIAAQLTFMIAIALPVAYLNVFVRDFEYLTGHIMHFWFFCSPVIWEPTMIPASFRWVLNYNPMTVFLGGYRNIIIYGKSPDFYALLGLSAVSCLMIGVMTLYYCRHEHLMVKEL